MNKTRKKKIALLYLLTGIGHYREAYSISKSFPSSEYDISFIDPIQKSKLFKHKIIDYFLNIYEKGFTYFTHNLTNVSILQDKPLSTKKNLQYYIFKIYNKVFRLVAYAASFFWSFVLDLDDYDYVISIHPVTTIFAKINKYFRNSSYEILNVIPDEAGISSAEAYSFKEIVNFVPSEFVYNILKNKTKIKESNLVISGHPLDPILYDNKEKIYKRVQRDLKNNYIHVGLYIGLFGPLHQKKQLIQTLKELLPKVNENFRISIISCGHKGYEKKVLKILNKNRKYRKYINTIFVDDYKELVIQGHNLMLNDINIMFSRPSELIFYSLGLGIPHIMFNQLGAQEFDMYEYSRLHGGSILFKDIKNHLYNYITNPNWTLEQSTKLYETNYNNNGAKAIYQYVNSK